MTTYPTTHHTTKSRSSSLSQTPYQQASSLPNVALLFPKIERQVAGSAPLHDDAMQLRDLPAMRFSSSLPYFSCMYLSAIELDCRKLQRIFQVNERRQSDRIEEHPRISGVHDACALACRSPCLSARKCEECLAGRLRGSPHIHNGRLRRFMHDTNHGPCSTEEDSLRKTTREMILARCLTHHEFASPLLLTLWRRPHSEDVPGCKPSP